MGLSNLTAKNLTAYLNFVQVESSGLMGVAVLINLWVIFFGTSLLSRNWAKSMLFASTFNVIFAIGFTILTFVSITVLQISIGLWVLSLMLTLFFQD